VKASRVFVSALLLLAACGGDGGSSVTRVDATGQAVSERPYRVEAQYPDGQWRSVGRYETINEALRRAGRYLGIMQPPTDYIVLNVRIRVGGTVHYTFTRTPPAVVCPSCEAY
jgi:hypothetical protein